MATFLISGKDKTKTFDGRPLHSLSDKYYLEIEYNPCYEFKIYRRDDGCLIKTHGFKLPFRWNFLQQGEKEYFITSLSSNGMTIIDCETGEIWSHEPEKYNECESDWMLVPGSNILVLNGYVHCGSYVFWRFYDFDLAKFNQGLPELEEVLPSEDAYLDDWGSFAIYQGKTIPESIVRDVKINPDDYYLVFTRSIEYNMAARMPQDDLLFDPEEWLPLLPEKEHDKMNDFLKKWTLCDLGKRFTIYYEEKKKLRDEFAPYLEKDLVKINSQEAILTRQDDKIIYLVLRNLIDEETGEMVVV